MGGVTLLARSAPRSSVANLHSSPYDVRVQMLRIQSIIYCFKKKKKILPSRNRPQPQTLTGASFWIYEIRSSLKRFRAIWVIVANRRQPLPTAKDAFVGGSGKTSHPLRRGPIIAAQNLWFRILEGVITHLIHILDFDPRFESAGFFGL